ncbi:MAG: CarD family transcriptional regulator [Acidisphaera sp.]|nr:CarD family transcriptional regulator [Acidisphaera sp.]
MAAVVVTEAMTERAFAATAAQDMPKDADPFQEGDAVVYFAHGVGRIDRIGSEEIAGHRLDVIQVSFLENQMTVRLPAAKARASGLRKLSTREAVDRAMVVLGGRPRTSKALWAKRAQEYQSKINSGDLMLLAEVLRDLRRNAGNLDGSFSERQIFETALDRFAAEVAVLNGTEKAAVVQDLTEKLKNA